MNFPEDPELPTQPEPPPFAPVPPEPPKPDFNGAALTVASSVAAMGMRAVTITIVWGLYISPFSGMPALPYAAALGLVMIASVLGFPMVSTVVRTVGQQRNSFDVFQPPQGGPPVVRMGVAQLPPPAWTDYLIELAIINPAMILLAWLLSLVLA